MKIKRGLIFSMIFFGMILLNMNFISSAPTCEEGSCVENFTGSNTFTVPEGITQITVEAWGGGGTGGSTATNSNVGAGGGAGGQYAKSILNVVGGQQFTYSVSSSTSHTSGANTDGISGGDTTFSNATATYVKAVGGAGGKSGGNGAAGGIGTATNGIGNVIVYAGGYGGDGASASGAGGGGAGSTGSGGNASTTTIGTGTANYGGDGGGPGSTTNGVGTAGNDFGGGGEGARRNAQGGDGAAGLLAISYMEVTDDSYPQFSNYGGTANNTVYIYNADYIFNVTIVNTNGTAKLNFNGVNYTATNNSNVFTVTISNLAAGSYDYIWYAWGDGIKHNINNSATINYNINKATLSASLTNNKSWTRNYDGTANSISYSESNTGDGDVDYTIYRDGKLVSDIDLIAGAGTYNYVLNSSGGTNYLPSSSLDTGTLTINSISPTGTITGSASIGYGNPAGVSISESNSGDSDVDYTLYRDGKLVSDTDNDILAVGTYNYVLNTTGGQNYTSSASIDTFQLTVTIGTPSASLTNNKAWTRNYDGTTNSISYSESNTGDGDVDYTIYRDGKLVSDTDLIAGAGTYNYILNTSGGTNYSSSASLDTGTLTINPSTSSCAVYFNDSSPVNFGEGFRVWGSCDSTFTLRRNGTIISNNSLQILEVGAYNFSVQRTDTSNYSNTYNEAQFIVNAAGLTGTITGTSPITYGTATNIDYTESNTGDGDVVYKLYREGVEVSIPDTATLSAGTYNYILNSTGGENYSSSASIDTFSLTVNKATLTGTITGTTPIDAGSPANIAYIESNTGDGDVVYKLYRGGVEVSIPDTSNLGTGTYNYILNSTGGENYSSSASIDTFQLISQAAPADRFFLGSNSRIRIAGDGRWRFANY